MERYNIQCRTCGEIFQPDEKSSLWWRAKNREEKFFIDCKTISGEEHGCISKPSDKQFIVSGYDMDCIKFRYGFDSMVEAVKCFRKLKKNLFNMVYITGLSHKVKQLVEG
jgi:hypothetical protein